jgi:hypothetical protein
VQPTGPDQPAEHPDEQPTRRLDDLWVPGSAAAAGSPHPGAPAGTGDMVDSADPQGQAASRRGVRGLVVAGAVVALVAAGAFGAALARGGGPDESVNGFAATGSATTDEDGTEDGTDEDGDGTVGDRLRDWAEEHGGPMLRHGMTGKGLGGMLGGPLLGAPLHGSYVVEDPDGGYRTVLTQRGKVTSVSGTSLTVRSADGFEATYRLTDDTSVLSGTDGTDDIAKGADVAVTGLRDGGSPRAVNVVDLSQLQERLRQHLDDLPGMPDDDDPTPSPTSTSGASV